MTVYYVTYILFFFFSYFFRHVKGDAEKRRKGELIALIGTIVIIVGLRHPSMGYDLQYGYTGGYIGSFHRIASLSWNSVVNLTGWLNYERGYVLFNKLISYVSKDTQWLLFCCALISIVPIGVMIHKYSRDTLFSVLVYLGLPCFMIVFSGLRQAIGIALCCLSYPYITEKKPLKFILCVLLASLFHYSAFFFLIAYPVFHLRIRKNVRMVSILVIPLIFLLRVPLFLILSELFKENAYIDYNGALTLLVVFALVYLFCAVFVDEQDEVTNGFLNLFYLGVLCMCFGNIYQTAMRIGYYFMIALAVALPNIVDEINIQSSKRISSVAIKTAFVLYGLYALWTSGSSWPMTYPYHFFWEAIY